jgi:hypothetical protein
MDGYLSQVCMLDGSVLDATSFGEFDANGIWRPIDITGLTFGTTGYLLDFADSSDLGNDVSGNDNDFTTTSMDTGDQVTDTPTTNYATLNPLMKGGGSVILADGNLNAELDTRGRVPATIAVDVHDSDGWYWECIPLDIDHGNYCAAGWGGLDIPDWGTTTTYFSAMTPTVTIYINEGGITQNGSAVGSFTTALNDDDVLGCAVRNGKVYFAKNNTWMNSGDPVGETGFMTTITETCLFYPVVADQALAGQPALNVNFGQLGFAYDPPTGFKAINTANLPEPTIKNSKKYFDTILYAGNGTGQKVGQFQPITETYSVGNSALFIDDDSCYLSRTPSLVGNSRTMTFSFWFKKGNNGIQELLHSVTGLSNYMSFNTTNTFQLNTSGSGELRTTRTFADSTQWYHFLVAIDTTQTTSSDRLKIYVNGVQETDFGSETYPAQNTEMTWNTATGHFIGQSGSTTLFVDGYMADAYFIDGQALAPSSFGEVDSTTNRWIPIAYYTFSSQNLGAAAADRIIVCFAIDGVGSTATAVTIGGVSATIVQTATTVRKNTLWYATVPTGTTGDVVVTGAAETEMGIALWRLTGTTSGPYDSGQSDANPGTADIMVPAGGVALAGMGDGGFAHSGYTWVGLTEDFDEAVSGAATTNWTGAHATNATAQDLTITATPAHSISNSGFQAVSFGPTSRIWNQRLLP